MCFNLVWMCDLIHPYPYHIIPIDHCRVFFKPRLLVTNMETGRLEGASIPDALAPGLHKRSNRCPHFSPQTKEREVIPQKVRHQFC